MRPLLAALTALALVTTLAPGAHASTLDLVFSVSRAGSASFAARVDPAGAGEFQAEIASNGNLHGSTEGFAMMLYHADRSFWFGIGVTGGISRERTILQTGVPTGVTVARSPLDGGSMRFTIGVAPGSRAFLVAWGAGLDTVDFRVWGESGTRVVANEGTALALGDPELENGSPNVEVQKNYALYQGVGGKVVRDASATLDVASALHGFWMHNNVKMVCESPAGCVSPATAESACASFAGVPCSTTRMSWTGPEGAGETGEGVYSFLDAPRGHYAFVEDLKVDAYLTSGQYVAPTGTLILPYEDYTYLNVADVDVPA